MEKLLGLVILMAGLGASNANATLAYTFKVTSEQATNNTPNAAVGYGFALDLADFAEGGSTAYALDTELLRSGLNPTQGPTQTFGDPADAFLSISSGTLTGYGFSNPMTVNVLSYTDDAVSFNVDPSGNITSGAISIQDDDVDLIISLSNGSFSGTYVTDDGPCFFDPGCRISGDYTFLRCLPFLSPPPSRCCWPRRLVWDGRE